MSLEDITIRQAKPREKAYKLSDAKGLHLLVNPTGSKLWRWQYRFAGKQKMLAFGGYPDISLKDARNKRDDARRVLDAGRDPSAERKQAKREVRMRAQNSFESVARRWITSRSYRWTQDYAGYVTQRLEANIFPYIGHRPIAEIEPPELLDQLRRIEAREAFEMASRVRGLCSQIWRFAIGEGIARRDAAADLKGVLTPYKSKKHPRVALEDLPELLRVIDRCEDELARRDPQTRIGLQLLSHVALRPGELRQAPWSEIDWKNELWRIPAARMKRERPHLVPLSPQAIGIIRELHELTGAGPWMFPGEGRKGVMSENTLNNALHALGYKGRHCSHGFRGVMSTALNERGFNSDWIELQLSHVEENEVRSAYNEAMWLDQRRAMMCWFSNYLDALRGGKFIRPTAFKMPLMVVKAA
jgi:integrase